MEWVSLDATAVCVGLLIVGLTAVWAYVMLGGSKQPDLSALYKKDPSGSGGKKAGKGGKAKSKQVCMSLRIVGWWWVLIREDCLVICIEY